MPFELDQRLQFLDHRQRVLDIKPRIDSSTPISYYASPKSSHYIPFSQRRSTSVDHRSFNNNEKKARSRSQISFIQGNIVFPVQKRNLRQYSSSEKLSSYQKNVALYGGYVKKNYSSTNSSLYSNCKSKVASMKCYQAPLYRNKQNKADANEAEKKTSTVPVVASATTDKGIKSRRCMDEFKDAILTNIINRGVFNDRIVMDCINDHSVNNQILSRAELEAVTLELIHDLNVSVDEGIKYGIDKNYQHKSEEYDRKESLEAFHSKSLESSASFEDGMRVNRGKLSAPIFTENQSDNEGDNQSFKVLNSGRSGHSESSHSISPTTSSKKSSITETSATVHSGNSENSIYRP